MKPDLLEELTYIFQTITPNSPETDIENRIVIPLLHLLGYNDEDWQEQLLVRKVKPDFLVNPKASPLPHLPYLVVEVKAARKNIQRSLWQIGRYMRYSGAVLGLLTNGYRFQILYNYNNEIEIVAEYSQAELKENFTFVRTLLAKKTSLKFSTALYNAQQRIRNKFIRLFSSKLEEKYMLGFFKRNEPTNEQPEGRSPSPTPSPPQAEPTSVRPDFKEQQAMIITVFNNKGGVGKTTLTINLAAALNKLGKRVLLIDIDAQANLTMGLGIDPLRDLEQQGKQDISHLLTDPRISLENVRFRKSWGNVRLDVVPSHIRLSEMEYNLMTAVDSDRVLAKKLKKYTSEYDFIFIDPPPSFGKVNTMALMASSSVLIPTQLSPYSIRALEYVINRAFAVDDSREEPLSILGITVSMYDRQSTKLASEMMEDIYDVLSQNPRKKEVSVFPEKAWIPRLNVVSTSPNRGYPLCCAEFDDKLSLREQEAAQDAFGCYTNLAQHLLSVIQKES